MIKWIYYSKDNFDKQEVEEGIAYQETLGYTLHHYGWIEDRFEVGLVRDE